MPPQENGTATKEGGGTMTLILFAAFCAAFAGFNMGVVAARRWNQDEHRRWFNLASQVGIAITVIGVVGLLLSL